MKQLHIFPLYIISHETYHIYETPQTTEQHPFFEMRCRQGQLVIVTYGTSQPEICLEMSTGSFSCMFSKASFTPIYPFDVYIIRNLITMKQNAIHRYKHKTVTQQQIRFYHAFKDKYRLVSKNSLSVANMNKLRGKWNISKARLV